MPFDAFISYSHAADGRLAPALQTGLQRLAKPWYRARALRMFRDESALSANPHLWASIEKALDESDWFVLLASPEAVTSEWVKRELDHWLATKSRDRILIAVTDGTWRWDTTTQALAGSSVPATLSDAFIDEPRHVDLRWARTRTDLDMHNTRFRNTIAELAAPMHGKAKDELESEDIRQHRQARRLARGSASVLALLLVLSVVFATFAVQQRGEARLNAKRAERQTEIARQQTKNARTDSERARRALNVAVATNLVVGSTNALRNGRTDLGLLLAIQAERLDPTPVTRSALLSAVVDQPSLELNLHGLARAVGAAFSGDNRLLAASSPSGELRIWDLRTGQPLPHQPVALKDPAALVGFADNGRTLVATTSHETTGGGAVREAQVLDVTTGHIVKSISLPTDSFGAATATMAPELIASNGLGRGVLFNTRSGQLIQTFASSGEAWALSADGAVAASYTRGSEDRVQAWSASTGFAAGPGCTQPGVTNAAVPSPDISVSVTADGRSVRVAAPPTFDSGDAVVLTCDVSNGHSTPKVLSTHLQGRSFAGVTPDDRYVVTRDQRGDGSLFVNDPTTGAQVGPVMHAPSDVHYMEGFLPVVFSPDGLLMSAPENDGTVRVWNTGTYLPAIATESTNAALQSLDRFGHAGAIDSKTVGRFGDVLDANVSHDGRFIAILTNTQLIAVDVKRAVTQSLPLQQLGCPQFDPSGISASLRGLGIGAQPPAIVVGCSSISPPSVKGGSLIYIDISKSPWTIEPPVETDVFTDNLLLSDNGQWLVAQSAAASDEGRLQVFRVTNDHLVAGPALDAINGLPLLTPDSKGFIVRHSGRTSRWDFADAKVSELQLPKTGDPVGLSADGKYLATVDSDQPNGVTLWDLGTKSSIGTLPLGVGVGADTSVAFGASDRSVVVGQRTRTTWDLEPDSWIRDACAVANRDLASDEWAAYLPGIPKQATCPGGQ